MFRIDNAQDFRIPRTQGKADMSDNSQVSFLGKWRDSGAIHWGKNHKRASGVLRGGRKVKNTVFYTLGRKCLWNIQVTISSRPKVEEEILVVETDFRFVEDAHCSGLPNIHFPWWWNLHFSLRNCQQWGKPAYRGSQSLETESWWREQSTGPPVPSSSQVNSISIIPIAWDRNICVHCNSFLSHATFSSSVNFLDSTFKI